MMLFLAIWSFFQMHRPNSFTGRLYPAVCTTGNNRGAHSETGNLAERESGHRPRTSRSNGSAPCGRSVKPLLQAQAKASAADRHDLPLVGRHA